MRRMHWILGTLWLTAFAGVVAAEAQELSDLRPVELRCEYATDPLGVDMPNPRLFWKLQSKVRGQCQSAYQVLVASSQSRLAGGEGDLWDSGKTVSSETIHVVYRGKPLQSSQQVFWKVRVWDKDERPSPWSGPACWTMGVLRPQDWRGRWITRDAGDPVNLVGASWIWYPEPAWSGAGDTVEPPNVPVGAERWFQRSFDVPARVVRRALLVASIDNAGEIWLNGRSVAKLTAWENAHVLDVTRWIRKGANLLAVRAENGGTGPNAAGLIARLALEFDNGQKLDIVTDRSWRSTQRPANESWTSEPANTGTPAVVLAAWGQGPWNNGVRIVTDGGLPLFRKPFELSRPLRRAVVHVCGLGHYDLFLDGRKVGARFLDPAWSVFEKTAYYSTFDITDALRHGERHVLGVMLGKGFYNTAGDRRVHGVSADRPLKLILQAHLIFADGGETFVVSDGSWKTADGPITHSAILGGEDYDARRLPVGWDRPGFSDAAWAAAVETDGPGGELVASYAPPMKKHDVFTPVGIDEPQPGVFVYDFGQNASAVPRLRVRGKPGQTLRLTPAEQRHGMSPRCNNGRGPVNPAGVGRPNYWQYTLRGDGPECWSPQFAYSGFQYLQLEGAVPTGRPNPEGRAVVEELVSVHVRSDAPAVGHFECSNPLFNDIDRIIGWAVRSNLAHVLTDCPHREKLGWLEVAYLMGPSIAGRYDVARFYSKVSRDCADSQASNGMVPTVAPAYPAFSGGFAYTPEWGAAAVIIPWQVYQRYGDRDILVANYSAMKGFVDYMRDTAEELVPRAGLGDWYDYGHGQPVGASRFTPVELSATATFYRCARVVADTARVLACNEDRRRYEELATDIARAFNARYFDGAAEYKNLGSPQTANSMALILGIVPAEREAAALQCVVQDIRRRGNQQTAGDIGFWYLLQTLAEYGRSDVIYDMAARTEMGSYGFIVRNGWTSMPEAWDANTGASMNHCMLGHIQEWFMGWVAGIRPDPAAPGFRRFIIQPHPVGALTWARGEYDSIRGKISAAWKRSDDGAFVLSLTVPPNTTAIVHLPAARLEDVTESGKPAGHADGVRFLREAPEAIRFQVEAGAYEFVARSGRVDGGTDRSGKP